MLSFSRCCSSQRDPAGGGKPGDHAGDEHKGQSQGDRVLLDQIGDESEECDPLVHRCSDDELGEKRRGKPTEGARGGVRTFGGRWPTAELAVSFPLAIACRCCLATSTGTTNDIGSMAAANATAT